MQLTAELDRTMGRQISQELREGWENLVPKVIATAEEETDNANIQAMILLAPADMSDGKCQVTTILVPCMAGLSVISNFKLLKVQLGGVHKLLCFTLTTHIDTKL